MGQKKAMSMRGFWIWAAVIALLLTVGLHTVPGAMAQSASNLPGPSNYNARAYAAPTRLVNAAPQVAAAMPMPAPILDDDYRLGSGDKIKITVYTETDLSGEYRVDGSGYVQLPLLGQLRATGLTIRQFEAAMTQKFISEDYLKNPRVSVEVQNYRPFYIIGEVKTPGEYAYVSGMNALNAVALAGGFTYRADEHAIFVRRNGSATETRLPADQTTRINPGDIIRIDERIF